jgi:hypothetical protein
MRALYGWYLQTMHGTTTRWLNQRGSSYKTLLKTFHLKNGCWKEYLNYSVISYLMTNAGWALVEACSAVLTVLEPCGLSVLVAPCLSRLLAASTLPEESMLSSLILHKFSGFILHNKLIRGTNNVSNMERRRVCPFSFFSWFATSHPEAKWDPFRIVYASLCFIFFRLLYSAPS